MADFKAVPGLCYELTADLPSDGSVLSLSNSSKLIDCLADKYTYLVISNGVNCEYVKVTVENGALFITERGLDFTSSYNFFKGDKVTFEWTDQAWCDRWDCKKAEDSEEELPPIKIPGLKATYDEELGQWCYEDSGEGSDIEWRDAKHSYVWKNGTITKTALPADQTLMDGCYENAKITVSGCRIAKVEQGDKPLYTPSVSNKCCPEEATDV